MVEPLKFEKINLPKPNINPGVSLMTAMTNRKTQRDFIPYKPLTIQQISNVLWSAYGVNRPELPKNHNRTVPSAVFVYPLEIYVVLEKGTFKYEPNEHVLIPMVEGNYSEKAGLQNFVKDASMNLIIFYNPDVKCENEEMQKHLDKTSEKNIIRAALDCGYCSQNIYLCCAAENLKCVARGMCDGEFFKKLMKLDKLTFLLSMSVGY